MLRDIEISLKPLSDIIPDQRDIYQMKTELVEYLLDRNIIQYVDNKSGFFDMDFKEVFLFFKVEMFPISKTGLYDEIKSFLEIAWPEFELRNVFIHK